jgi:nucleoid DNA-binding protein
VIKADLARFVYNRHGGISYREARGIVELVLDRMKTRLIEGEDVKLTGFGSFNVTTRKQKQGRNPQTGETITLKPAKHIGFRPSKHLKF